MTDHDSTVRAIRAIRAIRAFWSDHPVGSAFITADDWPSYFRAYDARRDASEPHIRTELAAIPFAGRRVLEIGPGQGTEAQRIIQMGAEYHGVDATSESIDRVRRRCLIANIKFASLQVMQAEALAFRDASFDFVFSHGVLHHSPWIQAIVTEIHRVLRPGGTAVVMLYHRSSINYHFSIRILRRCGILLLFWPPAASVVARVTGEPPTRLQAHANALRSQGLSYLTMKNFVHKSTDGPHNVFSSVFSERETRVLFHTFADVQFRKHLLNERHLPILRSLLTRRAKEALERRFGWHLWVFARKEGSDHTPLSIPETFHQRTDFRRRL